MKKVLRRRSLRPLIEHLEERRLLAFSVVNANVFGNGSLRLVADFNQTVNTATVQASDLVVDGSQVATSVNVVDADTVEFILPSLAAGGHSAAVAAGAIADSQGTGLDAFSRPFTIASAPQFTVKHNPRLQPGNAPLAGYAGGESDRVDILWQTIPGGAGTQDSFIVEYRPTGSTGAWQSAALNAAIATGVENRVVRTASIAGLNWNTNYTYRVWHRRADVVVGQYEGNFRTRLAIGDETPFTFAAYGDSASGAATGFRQVQSRINQNNPAFSVLLGDNIYTVGTHPEYDSRFDPLVNPEAATWMAGHIDYLGMGNHDIGTQSGLPTEQNFSVPVPVAGVNAPAAPPATERPEHNYSWDYGDVHFVTFDTNSYTDATRLDGLLKWVTADLAASTARWKIVYGHHPLAGTPDNSVNPAGNYYQQVVNRLKAAGVDLFMVGHSHTYSWTYPLTGQTSGVATYADHGQDDHFNAGEGLVQLVSGAGGVGVNSGSYSQFPFVAEGFTTSTSPPARLGYTQVSVTQNQLTVSYIAADSGAVIDAFDITKNDAVQTATFQQGAGGYTGTVDTFLQQSSPSVNNSAAASLNVDGDEPAGSGQDVQALLRFDNLFGGGAGQIPANATLRSATLQLQVTNAGNTMNLHRMLANWAATDTWNSRTGGVQSDGIEALATPDTSTGTAPLGQLSFNVLASLQAWLASPATNRGWAFLPTGTDGVDFHSSEGATRPKLIVSYLPGAPTNNPPVAFNDTATTNQNVPVAINVLANDSDPNGDALSVVLVTNPASGTAVVNANGTVTYTPGANFTGADSFTYRASDGAASSNVATVAVTVAAVAAPKFFVVDSSVERVFRYQANGTYLSQSNLASGNTSSRGVTTNADGSRLWVIDNNRTVYVYDAALTLLGSWTAGSLNTPTGIAVAGSNVWIVDSGNDRAYLYSGAATRLTGSAAATRSFALSSSNGSPQDLATDGTTIWVTQSGTTDRVFVYQASNGAGLGNWIIGSANTSPIGIALDPTGASTSLWIVDNSTDRVYEYANGRARRSGSQTASVSFALNSANGNPQGIADPRSLAGHSSQRSPAASALALPLAGSPTVSTFASPPAATQPTPQAQSFSPAGVATLSDVFRASSIRVKKPANVIDSVFAQWATEPDGQFIPLA